MSKHPGWLLFLLWTLAGVGGCEASTDDEPLVPSRQGTTQPGGGGDAITESEACERLREARVEVGEQLGCESEELDCPELIQPAGSDPCERYLYDEESLVACLDVLQGYESCDDFDRTPCVVTAQVQPKAQCGHAGSAGSPGGAGQPGAANSSAGGTGSSGGAGGQATGDPVGEAGGGGVAE